jgi:hypothetical protein
MFTYLRIIHIIIIFPLIVSSLVYSFRLRKLLTSKEAISLNKCIITCQFVALLFIMIAYLVIIFSH